MDQARQPGNTRSRLIALCVGAVGVVGGAGTGGAATAQESASAAAPASAPRVSALRVSAPLVSQVESGPRPPGSAPAGAAGGVSAGSGTALMPLHPMGALAPQKRTRAPAWKRRVLNSQLGSPNRSLTAGSRGLKLSKQAPLS